MSEHELERLLGGFAADTLTADEKQRLYSAALQDQQLFNALADEQALKELLADPSVRRRLLQVLNTAGVSGSAGSLSWLDWFRRPANLALAGGLATAVCAVVLGTKIYQDGLKRAAQSVATEEAKHSVPSASAPAAEQTPPAESPMKARENAAPTEPPQRQAPADTLSKREQSSALRHFEEQRTSDPAREAAGLRSEQDRAKRRDSVTQEQAKVQEEFATSADQRLSLGGPPPATAPAPMQAPVSGAVAPPVGQPSARALFYGEPARSDTAVVTVEKERAMQPLSDQVQPFSRPERKKDQLAVEKSGSSPPKPLGLRYSLDGGEREVREAAGSAAREAKRSQAASLTVEANQDSYIQIWNALESSTPQLVFPEKDSGQISARLTAGQRQRIPLPAASGSITIRLSRVPFGPITRQEAALLDRPAASQLQESIQREQATYVVNTDASPTAQLTIEIPLGR